MKMIEEYKKCGNCILCVRTDLGSECGLTDNPVDDGQNGCIDHIPEEEVKFLVKEQF